MSTVEHAVQFACDGETLIGVVSSPPSGLTLARSAVLIIVGGPQYRAGAHRQFVLLARALAADGHAVLRFDVRGMGDSGGEQRGFEQITPDIAAAVNALKRCAPRAERLVLFGLCDGASAALIYLQESRDHRIAGLCLLNPWLRSETTLARTQLKYYYLHRLRDPNFWKQVFAGRLRAGRVLEFATSLRKTFLGGAATRPSTRHSFQDSMALAWQSFDGRILLALSGDDYTAREFVEYANSSASWRGAFARRNVDRVDLEGSDHTLSTPGSLQRFAFAFGQWLSVSQGARST